MKRFGSRPLLAGTMLGLSLVLTFVVTQPTGAGVRVESGEVAKATYRSPRTVTYKSDLKTNEAEQKAAEQVGPVYRTDVTTPSQQEAKTASTLAAITGLRDQAGPAGDKVTRVRQLLPGSTDDQANQVLALDASGWAGTQAQLRAILAALQTTQVKADDINYSLVANRVASNTRPDVRQAIIVVGKGLLIPNNLIDEEATNAARNKSRSTVEPVSYTIERDQVVVYRGQVITPFDVERLAATGLTRPAFNWQKTLGVFVLVTLFSVLLLYLAPRYARARMYPKRVVTLLGIFAAGVTILGVTVPPVQPILAYVLPVAAPVLLLAIFYGFRLAILSAISLAALYALAAGGSFELFFIHLAAATSAILFARRINGITGFLQAGAVVAIVVFLGTAAFSLLAANFDPGSLPKFALAAALNGSLTATFVFAGVAFLGPPLGIVTFLQLLELENPRHRLLRQLASDAPGTYSHSLRMAGIVEGVAERVGANGLLARVQTLYHDIGKTANPRYFVENQRGGENPHSGLDPKESADILRTHISEGLRLAAEAGLPEAISRAIPEHHGTSTMDYFLAAARSKRGARVKEADYRYLGPKPQSKETAILMLADSVEAASRTLEQPAESQIRKMVEDIFNSKVTDRQLDQAPLTTKELTTLREALAESVINDLHKRIRYPKKAKPPKRRAGRNRS